MAGFTWVTFKENVAIALAVADLVGVGRQQALQGMWAAPPDPGALSVREYLAGPKQVRVANIFAANDPQSTLMNVRTLARRGDIRRPLYLVINCRPDRIERNGQMGELAEPIDPDRILVIGTPVRSATATVPPAWQPRITNLGGQRPARELLAEILRGVADSATLVLVGNIHGQGELLLDELAKLPEIRKPVSAVPAPTPPRVVPRQRRYDDAFAKDTN
jgi:hypothetical protein